MRKRIAAAAVAIAVLALLLAAMGQAGEERPKAGDTKISVIATVFPGYDFARQIAGDAARVRLLLPPGADSHSYQPTPQDIIAIQQADLFVYVGGESEHWVKDMLASMGENAPNALAMMDCVATLEEERSESMQGEDTHEAETHETDGKELDEHVWTSPANAMAITRKLAETLARLSPENAARFAAGEAAYLQTLEELDQTFRQVVKNGNRHKIIFGDRFPFRYFVHEYGLAYDAAFPGCSEDSEPSSQTLISLIREIEEERVPVVFHIEFSSRKTAAILSEETGAKPLLMHSCHNVSAEEMEAGATYVSLMAGNARALEEALR